MQCNGVKIVHVRGFEPPKLTGLSRQDVPVLNKATRAFEQDIGLEPILTGS